MREIDIYHDGHGLNESIRITADDKGPGGASHRYVLEIGNDDVAVIQFQKGPRNESGSTPGVTEAAILALTTRRPTRPAARVRRGRMR